MKQQEKINLIHTILEKKIYNFHELDEKNMILKSNGKATPTTQYYEKRELVDLMNDLFDAQIKYRVDNDTNTIIIE